MLTSILSCCFMVCCNIELAQPPQAPRPATFLGLAEERLLVLRLGMWPNLQVNSVSFERIRPGMTEADIEKMLGTPHKSEDVSKYSVMKVVPTPKGFREFRVMKTKAWIGMDQVIVIVFGANSTVEWHELRPLEEWARVDRHLDTRNDFEKFRDWFMARSKQE
jgi:hypothetical protein